MDQLFQFLFKYSRTVYAKGQFGFANRPSLIIIALLAVLVAVLLYFLYIRPGYRIPAKSQWALIALRTVLLGVLAVLLMRPVIFISSIIPRSSYVGVLVDDSRSMQISDENNRPRAEVIKSLIAPDSTFTRGLDAKFKIGLWSFSNATTRLKSASELTTNGNASDIAGALKDVVRDSAGTPLSAIVLVSDGAANTPRDLTAQLRELRARNLPVFTLGVGSAERFRDAEMVRVSTPRRVLTGSAVIADALVRLNGYDKTKISIAISEDGHALKTQQFEVKGSEAQSLTVEFMPSSPGAHKYTFAINPLDGETTAEDNAQETLIEITNDNPRILHMEGTPWYEYGFLRKSLAKNEKNVRVVSVLRSADNKFYRQGVESGAELATGFPKSEEELFRFQGIVLGSIEANAFTFDQLKMIEQFAARRGGGVLALGGRRSFDAGKYAGTPVADMLPVALTGADIGEPEITPGNFKATLTTRGQSHPITRLADDRTQSAKEWESLPQISIPQVLPNIKPGATILLEAVDAQNRSRTVPLLVEQKYGRGRSLALMSFDTFRWRMQMPSQNTSHENFWRQLLRYTISTTPNQTEVYSERDVYAMGDPVIIRGDVQDIKFDPIRDAQVTVRVTKPSGYNVDIPLQFDFSEEGNNFRGEFKADEMGLHKLELSSRKGGASVGTASSSFLVTELNREFHDAAQNTELLKRISAETGGKYYPVSKASELLDDIQYLEGSNSERIAKDLWDMPINFLLLTALAAGEWFLRKKKGLA
jgi:uncharacterized membrane protein